MRYAGSPQGPWVLVVDGSRGQNRSALAAVRALGMAGYRVAVTRSGIQSLAAASRFCSAAVPTVTAGEPRFAAQVESELASRDYLAALPCSDAAIMALSAPGTVYVDKGRLPELARAAGLVMPPGQEFGTLEEMRAAALPYPCVVKTSVKLASNVLPARLLHGPADLTALQGRSGPFMVQPFIAEPMHSVCGVMWRGRLVLAVHQRHVRLWPPTCGDTCAAVTIETDPELCARLEDLLQDYEGVFQAEFAGSHLLDINPRVYASLPLAVTAGANLVAYYCDLLRGGSPSPPEVATGASYRWWEGDIRHLLSQATKGRRVDGPVLLSRERATWSAPYDPQPTLMRLTFAARRALADLRREPVGR